MAYYDWNWASSFLDGGRKKHERPLYDRGLRIWKFNKWDADSDIGIGWKYSGMSNSFVVYHKDGTTTIQARGVNPGGWSPLNNYSTRLTIMRYAGISNLYQRDFKFYIVEDNAGITPPKIQGCRQCAQTGLADVWCYPRNCWDVETSDDGKVSCPTHPDLGPTVMSHYRRWHPVPCEHGFVQSGHQIKNGTTCYYCQGSKKRDYGSKPERTQWDGTPIRLRDGQIIKSAATLLERMVADYVQPIS